VALTNHQYNFIFLVGFLYYFIFDSTAPMSSFQPAATMFYTDIQTLRGLDTPVDYGSGIEYADGLAQAFAMSGIQIGLWLNGTAGCQDILDGTLNSKLHDLFRYLKHVPVPKIFLRVGYGTYHIIILYNYLQYSGFRIQKVESSTTRIPHPLSLCRTVIFRHFQIQFQIYLPAKTNLEINKKNSTTPLLDIPTVPTRTDEPFNRSSRRANNGIPIVTTRLPSSGIPGPPLASWKI
jgi:hypothetical protein